MTTKTPDHPASGDAGSDDDLIPLMIELTRKTFDKARAHVADPDPATSPLGDLAGTMSVEEYLARCLEIYFED